MDLHTTLERSLDHNIKQPKKILSLFLLAVISLFYFGFIFLIGFQPEFLLKPIFLPHVTLGIFWGAGIIILSMAVNASYISLNKYIQK